MNRCTSLFFAFAATLVFAACSTFRQTAGDPGTTSALPPLALPQTVGDVASSAKIKHVIVVIQENRSFDDFFATYPGADGATSGPSTKHGTVKLAKVNLASVDLIHNHVEFLKEYDDGKMDGFDLIRYAAPGGIFKDAGTIPYQYVDPTEIAPYWTLAKRYVLADHTFATQSSGSFTAHQDLIAGSTAISAKKSVIDNPSSAPWGCDAPAGTTTSVIDTSGQVLYNQGPFPCFNYPTIRDLLDAKHVSWKYYTPSQAAKTSGALWNAFDAIAAVRHDGEEWSANISVPETNVFTDISSGKLAAMSWVIPDFDNSDHPGSASYTGPHWVAQIVNAVGGSQYWKSTAIVIVWDDWGGFYDNVAPKKLDYQGLGFRVPMLIVSPYARKGYVSHTHYEFGSILKFVENNWNLGRLNTTDVRANSIAGAFDFTQAARAFKPVAAKYSRAFFLSRPPSNHAVDDE